MPLQARIEQFPAYDLISQSSRGRHYGAYLREIAKTMSGVCWNTSGIKNE